MSYRILSKFIKDISFEIPNAQAFAMLENEISKYNLTFDIKSEPYKKNIVEVNIILKILPRSDVKYKILSEINYAALVSIEDESTDKEKLKKIILVDVPTDIYPTLYETFVYLFKQAGVNTINIAKEVNFQKLYDEKNKS